MIKKKQIILILNMVLCGTLSAQTNINEDSTFYKNKISEAPETVFKKFNDAGMTPSNHVLSDAEQEKVAKAFSLLPPLYIKILKENLHSISFMDNMPNTALTSPIESADSIKKFTITFRAGILNETISEWATWKENSLYKNPENSGYELIIDAGKMDAFVYVLLHEATHVIDAILEISPQTKSNDSFAIPSSFTKDIWKDIRTLDEKYIFPILENTRFRGGAVQPISSAPSIYKALAKTPFVSLYSMASWHEDIAELFTIYHLTTELNQPFIIYIKEKDKVITKFEPMKNKKVKRRLKNFRFTFYQE